MTQLISRLFRFSVAAVGFVGNTLVLSTNPQACARGGLRPCATCLARGKNLADWRGRHGADLNGQVSDRRRAPHRAEHACRGSIPIIADRVHVRCCPRRRRLPGCFCACAAKLRFSSAATVIAARFTAHKGCAQTARRDAQRAAGRRYQASRRGRVNHAARAGRYRARQNNVTHQGSPPRRADDLVTASAVVIASKPPSASPGDVARRSPGHRSGSWSCHWCGCRCPPFVRREFLRRRTGSIRRQTSPRRTP